MEGAQVKTSPTDEDVANESMPVEAATATEGSSSTPEGGVSTVTAVAPVETAVGGDDKAAIDTNIKSPSQDAASAAAVDKNDKPELPKRVDFELPASIVSKIVKATLGEGAALSSEAKEAFSKAAGIFILYLTSTAHEFCKERKRSTLSGDDVVDALAELEFDEMIEPLKAFREEIKRKHAARRSTTTPLPPQASSESSAFMP